VASVLLVEETGVSEENHRSMTTCINIFICVFVPKFQNFRDCLLLIVGDTTMTEMQHNNKSAVPLFEFVLKCNVK
jgi:hypothetical protein